MLFQVPLARLDSLESTLASLLDFDEDGNMLRLESVDNAAAPSPGTSKPS